jgi:hypothetical protein
LRRYTTAWGSGNREFVWTPQSGADPPSGKWVYEPIDHDPFPETDTEPVLIYANA